MSPANLIVTARLLYTAGARETGSEQAQAHLKRAVSTAYYAMFHAVCANTAALLPDASGEQVISAAWLQAYRGPEHTHARNQCRNTALMAPFPPEIRNFAETFVRMQSYRNQADYNPLSDFRPVEVSQIIDDVEDAINHLLFAPAAIRRAFAITILLRNRAD